MPAEIAERLLDPTAGSPQNHDHSNWYERDEKAVKEDKEEDSTEPDDWYDKYQEPTSLRVYMPDMKVESHPHIAAMLLGLSQERIYVCTTGEHVVDIICDDPRSTTRRAPILSSCH
jgi:hypothetical protein